MRIKHPLYAKILGWLLLNLVVLGGVFFWLLQLQLPGIRSTVATWVGERLQSVCELIGADLRAVPKSQWDSVLLRYSQAYGIQFYLFTPGGNQVAGELMQLPHAVGLEIIKASEQPLRRRMAPGISRNRGGGGGEPGLSRTNAPAVSHEAIHWRASQRFFLRTTQPTRYWGGLTLPPLGPEHLREGPLALVAMSSSLAGGGLFIDYTPWLLVALGVFLISALIWAMPVRGITHSIQKMMVATQRIAEGRFESKVGLPRGDELGQLGEAIDQMATRLSTLVNGQKRFLGDVAHELCSPLARMQMSLGILEQKIEPEHKTKLEDLREEMQLMSNLVNELLAFSRAALNPQPHPLQPVALHAVVAKALKREAIDSHQVQTSIPSDLTVLADPELLIRALANLLRNAIRYAGDAGPITVRAEAVPNAVRLLVCDQGPGVAEQDLRRLFDPFYRPDAARARETGGFGLGLAIVKTCLEACQGTVHCRNRQPQGLEVELRLTPAMPPASIVNPNGSQEGERRQAD